MRLHFSPVDSSVAHASPLPLSVEIDQLIIAGWAGRDRVSIEHHIAELAALGVARPSAVPLYYRVAAHQLIQSDTVDVVGEETSGEVELFVFRTEGVDWVSLISDHTDRALEAHSVALSKQVCPKPVARQAWRLDDLRPHIDTLRIRSWITAAHDGVDDAAPAAVTLYQEGTLAQLLPVDTLIDGWNALAGTSGWREGCAMSCGTVAVIGGIRPASLFQMELHDPQQQRSIRHAYRIQTLPIIT